MVFVKLIEWLVYALMEMIWVFVVLGEELVRHERFGVEEVGS